MSRKRNCGSGRRHNCGCGAGAKQRCPPRDAHELSVIERQTNHSAPFAPLRRRDSGLNVGYRTHPKRNLVN